MREARAVPARRLVTGHATGDRRMVLDPEDPNVERFRDRYAPSPVIAYHVRNPQRGDFLIDGGELRERRRKLDVVLSQIDQLVTFIANGHGTAAVAEKLRGLERTADAERHELAALERDADAVIQLPAPDDLLQLVFDLQKRLLGDPGRAREELRHIFRDGRITLVPQPGGFYIARSEILPLVPLTPPPSEGDQGGRYTAVSCAGRI